MKVKLDIDCTPEEARRFFGLPDVGPMQKTVMDAIEKRMLDAIEDTDTRTIMQTWLPLAKGFEQWQQLWGQMLANAAGANPVRAEPPPAPTRRR